MTTIEIIIKIDEIMTGTTEIIYKITEMSEQK